MTRAVHLQAAPVSVEAKRHIYAMDQAAQAVPQRFQRRHPSGCQELMYMFDGDDNGVCRFIATSYGQQEWVNPVLSGQIKVSRVACWCFGIASKAFPLAASVGSVAMAAAAAAVLWQGWQSPKTNFTDVVLKT